MTAELLPIAKDVAPVLAQMFDRFGPKITARLKGVARNVIDRAVADFQIGFNEFLKTSYEKCHVVKTLLSQDKPLPLLDLYVHLNLDCDSVKLNDDTLILKLATYRRVVITGLAGCGKSMFMRYLTISKFENAEGVIPLFIEMRQINALTSKDLLAFIYHFSASAKTKVTRDQFDLALKAGALLLILDGFDEVEHAHRSEVVRQILDLSTKYPDTQLVISSRPDPQFGSWNAFYVFKVREFSKAQVIELLNKIDYDKELKNRFKREVTRTLFSSHGSFLSSPLLASIMLLTYEQFAEIPNKMHIFYEQAFDALFRRHDAQKAQFIRKTYSGLPIDEFKKFFAAFCAMSYLEERFSFSDEALILFVGRALDYSRLATNPNNVVADLRECVCMLQREGLDTVFVHRSFQEYFSALFIATYFGPRCGELIEKFAQRVDDNVLPMLLDMATEKIEQEWVLPRVQGLLRCFDTIDVSSGEVPFRTLAKEVSLEIDFDNKGLPMVSAPVGSIGENFPPCSLILKLYSALSDEEQFFGMVVHSGIENHVRRFLARNGIRRGASPEDVRRCLGLREIDQAKEKRRRSVVARTRRAKRPGVSKSRGSSDTSANVMAPRLEVEITEEEITGELVERLHLNDVIKQLIDPLRKIEADIEARASRRRGIVELLFQSTRRDEMP